MLLVHFIAKAYTVPTTTLPAKAYDTILRGGVHVEPVVAERDQRGPRADNDDDGGDGGCELL